MDSLRKWAMPQNRQLSTPILLYQTEKTEMHIFDNNNNNTQVESFSQSITKTNRAQSKVKSSYLGINEKFQNFIEYLQANTNEEVDVAQNNVFWKDVIDYTEDSVNTQVSGSEDANSQIVKKEIKKMTTRNSINMIKGKHLLSPR